MPELTNPTTQPTIPELMARIDKLEQELDWTRGMLDIIRETMEDMGYNDPARL
jgi:hypothetical protein